MLKKILLTKLKNKKEIYCSIKDNIDIYSKYSEINISCYGCGETNHIALNCPRIHFVRNKEKLHKQFLLESKRMRAEKKRKRSRFNALFYNDEVISAYNDFNNFIEYYKENDLIRNLDLDNLNEDDCFSFNEYSLNKMYSKNSFNSLKRDTIEENQDSFYKKKKKQNKM